MGFSLKTHSLSALTPVKFTYKFNKEEKLSGTLNSYNNKFEYYKYSAFENFHAAALSKKNCLILTDNKPLREVFEQDSRQLNIGTIAGCFFIRTLSGKHVKTLSDFVYVGGVGTPLFITVIPIEGNIVELKINNTKYLQVEENYPFTVILSKEILDDSQLYKRRFEMDYKDGLICFKTKTKDGDRYLSYGSDFVLRAIGVTLNDVEINPYLFVVEPISESHLHFDFDAKSIEVKYHNSITNFAERSTLNIKDQNEHDTNLLVSCTTNHIALSGEAVVNISLTKTNFSSSGSYLTKQ